MEPDSLGDLWPELPDAVIHLAGQTYVPEAFRDPAGPLQINLLGTLNLLQALKARGFRYLSGTSAPATSTARWPRRRCRSTRTHPPPAQSYAVSKLAAESLAACSGVSPKAGGAGGATVQPYRAGAEGQLRDR